MADVSSSTSPRRRELLWAALVGGLCAIPIPWALKLAGYEDAALAMIYPGLLPILWSTGGFFASLSWLGEVQLLLTNFVFYSAPTYGALRLFSVFSRGVRAKRRA